MLKYSEPCSASLKKSSNSPNPRYTFVRNIVLLHYPIPLYIPCTFVWNCIVVQPQPSLPKKEGPFPQCRQRSGHLCNTKFDDDDDKKDDAGDGDDIEDDGENDDDDDIEDDRDDGVVSAGSDAVICAI